MELLIPTKFHLSQNYPNPFKDKTKIKYCIAFKTKVRLLVLSSDGKVVEELLDEEKDAGTYEIEFSAYKNHKGESRILPDGSYFYQLKAVPIGRQAGDFLAEKEMKLLNK